MYTSTFLANNPSGHATYSAGSFNGKGKGIDSNFIEDYDRLVLIGANASENSEDYWLASRFTYELSSYVHFGVNYISSSGEVRNKDILNVSTDYVDDDQGSYGVRPVISISESALANYLD